MQTDTWSPIRPLIAAFNSIRAQLVVAGERLLVDESMSKWEGLAADIKHAIFGHPHPVSVLSKPVVRGTEFNVICDCETGLFLGIEVEDTPEAMRAMEETEKYAGTAILMRLTKPWYQSRRIVFADSRFASAHAAARLQEEGGLRFTGVVKTAHRMFPLTALTHAHTGQRGLSLCYEGILHGQHLLACAWQDTKMMCFITNYGTASPGEPLDKHYRHEFRNACGDMELPDSVPCLQFVRDYLDHISPIDISNHIRQGCLHLEESILTHIWWHRVFTTILGMIEVDAFRAFSHFYKHGVHRDAAHKDFTFALVVALLKKGEELSSTHASTSHAPCPAPRGQVLEGNFHFLDRISALPQYAAANEPRLHCIDCHDRTVFYCLKCYVERGELFGVCPPFSSAKKHCLYKHSNA